MQGDMILRVCLKTIVKKFEKKKKSNNDFLNIYVKIAICHNCGQLPESSKNSSWPLVRATCRWLFRLAGEEFLGTGTIMDLFRHVGTTDCSRVRLSGEHRS